MLWYKLFKFIYFCCGSFLIVLSDLEGKKCVFLVIDCFLFNNGYVDDVVVLLKV